MELNYYQLLGVSPLASNEEIKSAFKKLAKKYHPDKNPGNVQYEEYFKKINEAYQTLSDSHKRSVYDFKLKYYTTNTQYSTYTTNATSYSRTGNTGYRPPKKKNKRKKTMYTPVYKRSTLIKFYIFSITFVLFLSFGGYWFYKFMNKYAAEQLYKEGLALENIQDYKGAMIKYTEAIAYMEELPQPYARRAQLRMKFYHDYAGACKDFEKAIQLGAQSSFELFFNKAKCGIQLKKYDIALKDLEAAIQIDPLSDSANFYKAEVLNFALNNYTEAINEYSKVIEINPDFEDAWFGRAISKQSIRNYAGSIDDFTHLLSITDDKGHIYYYRAFSKLGISDTLGACNDFALSLLNGFQEAEKPSQLLCIPFNTNSLHSNSTTLSKP
ncbi:MAG TPA: DnaJ domain-containing protein [Cytophagaceae bacterium]